MRHFLCREAFFSTTTLTVGHVNRRKRSPKRANASAKITKADDDNKMCEGRRALPLWMSKKEDEGRKNQSLNTTRKKKSTRAVVYCMNEKELREAAGAYLGDQHVSALSGQQVQSKLEYAAGKSFSTIKKAGKLETPEEGEAACVETYVSETDLDVTDMETVPYAESIYEEKEDMRLQTEKTEKQHLTENQGGDDAMRLVREIFFS